MELRRATSWLSANGCFGLLYVLMQSFSEGSLLGSLAALASDGVLGSQIKAYSCPFYLFGGTIIIYADYDYDACF